ncbi:MAG: type I-E CRISPR-associated protein Cse1/CasA [Chloroflexi bacterium]|nr:type I-E CRISPR-associated protein Cse1/CasA [Chloroflexota bacterium]
MSDVARVSEQALKWNVLTERWIESMEHTGGPKDRSPLEALAEANALECITAPNPLDLFAVHRFLLTLLYWKAEVGGGVVNVRESLLRGRTPRPVLDAIAEAVPSFNLFDQEAPFLQDPTCRSVKENARKSPGYLFSEMATGTNVAHFHHGQDKDTRLCPRCATLGMIRLVPWTQSGGSGLSPSVHNSPPIMALASGENLAVTLGLNLIPIDAPVGEARWSGHFVPSDKANYIPYLEAFTWNPRRVLLFPPEFKGGCSRCGRTDLPTLGRIAFVKNEETRSMKKRQKNIPFSWKDPSAFYNSDPNNQFTTIKSGDEKSAASNNDLSSRLFSNRNTPQKPTVFEMNKGHQGWILVIPCTNPANNKAFDHRMVELTSLTSEAIREEVHADKQDETPEGLDGWRQPGRARSYQSAFRFVKQATRVLNHGDWSVLSEAAYKSMQESPAGFDVLTGLLWPLRSTTRGLPSRNVAWLVLKLMSSVPSGARTLLSDATFSPLRDLPKREAGQKTKGGSAPFRYPVSLPAGHRLESELRRAIASNNKSRSPRPIDWANLCHDLDQLLD